MNTDPPTPAGPLNVDLRFQLTLTPAGPAPGWHASLAGERPEERLRFGSLPELIRYLVQLDLQTPPQTPLPRGIR